MSRIVAIRKTRTMLAKERELGEPIELVLRRLYYVEDLSLSGVGQRLGIDKTAVWQWLRRCRIPTKRMRPPVAEALELVR